MNEFYITEVQDHTKDFEVERPVLVQDVDGNENVVGMRKEVFKGRHYSVITMVPTGLCDIAAIKNAMLTGKKVKLIIE